MTITDARDHLAPQALGWLDTVTGNGSGTPFEVLDPGTGLLLAELTSATVSDVDEAVRAARAALEDGRWSEQDADHREQVLHRLADLVQRDFDLLVSIEALDTGKPLAEAWFDITEVISVLRYYAGWCTKVTGTTIPAPRHLFAVTLRGPVGVCAAITPWNYPLPILMYKLAPALAFGNSFIAKPSELAPLSSLHFARLCAEAGVPEGVVTVLTGSGATGAALAAHPGLDKIAFTGSTNTGRAIMRAAAERPTRVSLELGGKSPHIVFGSADLPAAADGVALGIWTNAGQVCIAGSRLLVERSVHDEFLDLLAERTRGVVLGHALDPQAQMGPMITETQRSRAQGLISAALEQGACAVTGGASTDGPGFFLQPTVLTGLPTEHPLSQEEIFGPVLVVDTFETEQEAITKGNATPYGLAAGVWTGRSGQGQRMARGLSAGSVWVNTYGVFHPTLPFGGTKASGFGRELGESAVEAYTEITTVVEDLSAGAEAPHE
jgi:acyl-CoA reductase-like NAD-dependent aldehyde dehydrogenase